jgi:hypothetical protein
VIVRAILVCQSDLACGPQPKGSRTLNSWHTSKPTVALRDKITCLEKLIRLPLFRLCSSYSLILPLVIVRHSEPDGPARDRARYDIRSGSIAYCGDVRFWLKRT